MKLSEEQETRLLNLRVKDVRLKKLLNCAIEAWKKVGYSKFSYGIDSTGCQSLPCCLIGSAAYGKLFSDSFDEQFHKLGKFFMSEFEFSAQEKNAIMTTFDYGFDETWVNNLSLRGEVCKIRSILFQT